MAEFLKNLKIGDVLTNENGEELTILSRSESLVWTSLPDQPDQGGRCWSEQDLIKNNLTKI